MYMVLTAPKTQITKRLMMKEIKRAMPEKGKRQWVSVNKLCSCVTVLNPGFLF